MKKNLLFLLIPFILIAEDRYLSNFKIGIVNTENQSNNLYFGTDFLFPSNSFSFGVGIDIVGLGGSSEYTNSYGNYTLGGQLKIAYSLKSLIDFPIILKADLGYGVTQYYKKNYWGYQYGANIESYLYKNIGIGVGYKRINTSTILGKTNNYLFYTTFFF